MSELWPVYAIAAASAGCTLFGLIWYWTHPPAEPPSARAEREALRERHRVRHRRVRSAWGVGVWFRRDR